MELWGWRKVRRKVQRARLRRAKRRARRAGRKIGRRIGIAVLAMLLLLLVVFFLFPIWISNQQGRVYMLDRLNRQLNEGAGAGGGAACASRWEIGAWGGFAAPS